MRKLGSLSQMHFRRLHKAKYVRIFRLRRISTIFHMLRNAIFGVTCRIVSGSPGGQILFRMMSSSKDKPRFLFRQLFEHKSCTFTYLLADRQSKEAILIDPVYETVDRDRKIVDQLGLKLKYAINTHVHADHVTGSGKLKGMIEGCRSALGEHAGAQADVKLSEGDRVKFGDLGLTVFHTPGHTNGCMTYVLDSERMAFTGDALLIRGCGRTDFQQGDSGRLYDSVHGKILSLPDDYRLYPAHDYTGQTMTTVAEEKEHNARLTKPRDEFVELMANLNLPYPKLIDKAVPANMICGLVDDA